MGTRLSLLVVSQIADPTQFWSAIFTFCSENGRWQAAISSSAVLYCCNRKLQKRNTEITKLKVVDMVRRIDLVGVQLKGIVIAFG